ncbi:hypothetical protein FKM82_016328 [Ascaphus truei]
MPTPCSLHCKVFGIGPSSCSIYWYIIIIYASYVFVVQMYGKTEHQKFREALSELSTIVQAREAGSQRQRHSAAKDLTGSPDLPGTPTIQVTYLPSSQKSKRPKHFLELKSFKDNYNTLESTL